ncbi:hypothetical protein Tco_0518449, partial [Tanacetum coccineum]
SNVHQVFYWSDSPKENRGKGLQGKKTTDDSQETIDVSEESEPEPKPAKKKTSSKRRLSLSTKLKQKKQDKSMLLMQGS